MGPVRLSAEQHPGKVLAEEKKNHSERIISGRENLLASLEAFGWSAS